MNDRWKSVGRRMQSWGHRSWMAASCAALLAAGPVAAEDNASLKADIEVLRSRLSTLENRLSNAESSGSPSLSGKPGAPTIQLPSAMQDVQISGYTDVSAIYNFNRPNAGVGRTNRGRVFDTQSNGFTIQAFSLTLEKPLSNESPIGFRTDILAGDDAELIHSTGLGIASDAFDLQQAYVTARAPIGNGLDFKMGKFVTLLGSEVIRSLDNWNFSRSYMFGFSIPFTHTGALASYPIGEYGTVTAGLVNGWDIVDENNQFKDMIGSLTLTPIKDVSLSFNGITGAERAKDNRNDRSVLDIVASWKPIDQLTLMANYDYGHESSVAHGVAGTAGFDTGNWQGLALYSKYDLTDKWSLAGRWEVFNDMDNIRTALTGPGGTTLLNGVKFYEWTLTSQWVLYEHTLARLEYRHDWSDERVFFREASAFSDYQDTISAEVICHF